MAEIAAQQLVEGARDCAQLAETSCELPARVHEEIERWA